MENHIIEIVAGIFLLIAIIWATFYIYKNKKSYNHYLMEFIPNMFPTLGMLGTFGGITYGLWFFNANNLEESIPNLLQGLTTAFFISIAGVFFLLIFSFITNYYRYKNEKDLKSDETLALHELIKLKRETNELLATKISHLQTSINENNINFQNKIDELRSSLESNAQNISSNLERLDNSISEVNIIEFEGEPIHIGKVLISTYDEIKQQTSALQNFSTDLANTIQTGFTQIKDDTSITDTITSSFDKLINDTKVTEKLDSVRTEISGLGTKLQSPAEDVVKGLSENLAVSMQEILQEVKGSIGDGINSDMAEVARELKSVSTNLNDFPDKINMMASGLETTFKKLEEGLVDTSTQTSDKSKEAIENIAKQMQLLEATLKNLAENITNTTNQSTENVKNQFSTISNTISAYSQSHNDSIIKTSALVEMLNNNIMNLNTLSTNFVNTISNINTANDNLKLTSTQFQSVSSKIESSANSLVNAQNSLIANYDKSLVNNKEILNQYVSSLKLSQDFNKDLVSKYAKVNDNFSQVFKEVDAGIKLYSSSVKGSLEGFLTTYNTALTTGTKSLENAVSGLSESFENLSDVLIHKK